VDLTDEELVQALEAAQSLVLELTEETASRVPENVVRLSGYSHCLARDHVLQAVRLRNNIAAEADIPRKAATEALAALVALVAEKGL